MMNSVLRRTIRFQGAISVADFMRLSLSHPLHGYYASVRNPVLGRSGEFWLSDF
jgi:SAM-dependent MidA family methyltransferase